MRLEWTATAKRDLKDIVAYIWLDNPEAAKRMRDRLRASAELLKTSPYAGRPGALLGTRELIAHPNYRIIYEIKGETVSVLTLIHAAREWPPVEDDA
ncbi:MAG TPA: type II toxin-antitoxin system RelE/ParE family toxin [Mesorhizobium sp.]|nr:type II toxin-antitoxin system RelE/ParE family toxin [Mesorhizobium sp.]